MHVASNSDDDGDEWLFNSVRLYDDLHMYELQHSAQTIEWMHEDKLVVAVLLENGGSDLLQLSLPSALVYKKSQGGGQTTDFKVLSGGWHKGHVVGLRHIPESRPGLLAVADAVSNSLTLWNLPDEDDESGLMTEKCCIKNPNEVKTSAKMDVTCTNVAFGSHMNHVSIVDIDSQKVSFSPEGIHIGDGELSNVYFLTESTLLLCDRNSGQLRVIDTRTSASSNAASSLSHPSSNICTQWTCDLRSVGDVQQAVILRLSSDGIVYLSDLRQLNSDISSMPLHQKNVHRPECHYMSIKIGSDELFSVSGFNDEVSIYSVSQLSASSTAILQPVFVHSGHCNSSIPASHTGCKKQMVQVHSWHPVLERTLLSGASEGSLHAWKFNSEQYKKIQNSTD